MLFAEFRLGFIARVFRVALGIIGWELIVLTKKKKKEKFDE